jgi:hypothetical protein
MYFNVYRRFYYRYNIINKNIIIFLKSEDLGLKSICFPVIKVENISSNKSLTAIIMLLAIKTFIEENQSKIKNLKSITISVDVKL